MYSVTLPTLLLQIINATQVVDKCICVKKNKMYVKCSPR